MLSHLESVINICMSSRVSHAVTTLLLSYILLSSMTAVGLMSSVAAGVRTHHDSSSLISLTSVKRQAQVKSRLACFRIIVLFVELTHTRPSSEHGNLVIFKSWMLGDADSCCCPNLWVVLAVNCVARFVCDELRVALDLT